MFAAEDRWLVELLKSTRSVRTRRAARAGEYECAGRCLISSLPFATCAEGFLISMAEPREPGRPSVALQMKRVTKWR